MSILLPLVNHGTVSVTPALGPLPCAAVDVVYVYRGTSVCVDRPTPVNDAK